MPRPPVRPSACPPVRRVNPSRFIGTFVPSFWLEQNVVTYDYSFDAAHRLKSVTDNRGNKSLTYTWSPGGRLARVEDSDGHSTSTAYDAVGRLSSLTAPNAENISFVWDAGGRLVEKRLNSGLRNHPELERGRQPQTENEPDQRDHAQQPRLHAGYRWPPGQPCPSPTATPTH